MKRLLGLVAVFAISFSLTAADNKEKDPDEIGNRDVGKGLNWYSLEKEIAIGKQLAQQVERQAKLIDDPVISEYVNRLGQNLVRNSDAKVPFTIKVIDTEEVNAFALPGGFFFVNSGLILKADTEAELAGVMAHEIAHVAARHGTRQATRGQVAQLATIPLIFMGGWAGYRCAAGRQHPSAGRVPSILARLRIRSRHARFGVHVQDRVRSRSVSSISSRRLESLEKKKPGTMAKVFSTHPPTDDRIVSAQKNIQDLLKARPEYVVTTSEFNDVKARLAMLHNRRKVDDKDQTNRPRLRKSAGGRSPAPAAAPMVRIQAAVTTIAPRSSAARIQIQARVRNSRWPSARS